MITALLDHGADINAQNYTDGNTAIHVAVLHGVFPRDFHLIKYLLQRNIDLTIRNKVSSRFVLQLNLYDCS